MGETKPVRLQRSRAKGSRLVSPNGLPVVCVTRGTRWGNPFKVGDPHPLYLVPMAPGDSVKAFRDAINPRHDDAKRWMGRWAAAGGDVGVLMMLRDRAAAFEFLRGKNLACWCKPDAPCHADVLLTLANAPAAPEATTPGTGGREMQ